MLRQLRAGYDRRPDGFRRVGYLDRCAAEAGHLVVFDRDESRSWSEKVFDYRRTAAGGAEVHVWGM